MSIHHPILLFVAGLIAGALNAAAGGGSFITFPALIYAGAPPIIANASSTVALFPGSVVSTWAYRKDIRPFPGVAMSAMIALTLIGGCCGAILLLFTPSDGFNKMVPWLLLTGSLFFAFGKSAGNVLRRKFHIGAGFMLSLQFLLGIYGGFFGGAVGIMMMAVYSVFGLSDIKAMNATKTLLVGVANSVAVAIFIVAGKVDWPPTGLMLIATTLGGYAGALFTRRLNPNYLRVGLIVFSFVLTVVFFFQTYR
jgi:uncharacterized membrane protein YfcA